jgi:copper chaperone
MTTKLIVDNMKCGGCAGSIKKGLKSFKEVSEVTVDVEHEMVEITHQDNFPVETLKEKLSSMGYPEK